MTGCVANDSNDKQANSREPILPVESERMSVSFVDAPHPAVIPLDELLDECELRTQRRSGPGGQHRNKTSSGVFLTHKPTGVVGEATERRSQAQNREVALERLRFRLAVEIRTHSVIDQPAEASELDLRERYYGKSLKLNDSNVAKPAVMAMLLNDLHASGGQPSAVSKIWKVSTSAVIALVKGNPQAFSFLNQTRAHHGRRGLK